MMKQTLLALVGFASALTAAAHAAIPVFPGAEGHGVYTVAGRGGRVIRVTNLEDSGTGSFRAAVEDSSGPRTVIFEVGGYVDLASAVTIASPFITIAGQTAPAPGVVLQDYFLAISTHDVLVQHLTTRVGDRRTFPAADPTPDGLKLGLWQEPDSVYNVVIDHCSFVWALDEGIDFMRGVHDVTISNTMICQALRGSVMDVGISGTGPLLVGDSSNITFFRNLFAHNGDRNPKYGDASTGAFANNILFNVKNSPDLTPLDPNATGPILLSFEGNLYKTHETSTNHNMHALLVLYGSSYFWQEGSKVWIDDNVCDNCTGAWTDDVHEEGTGSKPQAVIDLPSNQRQAWPDSGLSVAPADSLLISVLPGIGAFPGQRADVEDEFIQDVINETGGRVDCVEDEQITLDTGSVVSATSTTLVLEGAVGAHSSTYVGYSVRITDGLSTQTRTVSLYEPSTASITVSPAWSSVPDDSYTWEIFQSCDVNAGGWGTVPVRYRTLILPTNLNGDDDSDGYRNLEEWLHTFPRDSTEIANVSAFTDSSTGGNEFSYQYKAKVVWTTDQTATTQVRYRRVGDFAWSQGLEQPTPVTSHFAIISGLEAGEAYELQPLSVAGGVLSAGIVDTAATDSAAVTVSNFGISQVPSGNSIHVAFTYNTSANSSCVVNVRKEQSPVIEWGDPEVTDSTLHGTSHTHVVTGLLPNTYYHAYIHVFDDEGINGEDTVFPDGAVPGSTATTVYIRILTPSKGSGGGGYEFEGAPLHSDFPKETYLGMGYPNPFNPSVAFDFGIAGHRTRVRLDVFDVRGRRVLTLLDEDRVPGRYHVTWDGRDQRGMPVGGGVYFVRMTVNEGRFSRKVLLLK